MIDDDVGDDLLRLIFTSCHPVLSMEARVALTLRLLGGLTTEELARAFLVPEPTMAQRLVRAKRTLAEKQVPFEVPKGEALAARLASVLEVIYLIFNEGYAATAGDDWMRPALCEDALRLGRIVAGLAPLEPEVHGLVALMEISASRSAARTTPEGEPILLLEQDRSRWDQAAIRRGLSALTRAEELGGARGYYALQAAVTGLSRSGAHTRRDRLGAHRVALRRARRAHALAGRRAESRGRGLDGGGACSGPRARRRPARRPVARELPPAPERARGLAREARATSRSARRVRARRVADAERAPARSPARTRRGFSARGRRGNSRVKLREIRAQACRGRTAELSIELCVRALPERDRLA